MEVCFWFSFEVLSNFVTPATNQLPRDVSMKRVAVFIGLVYIQYLTFTQAITPKQ